MPTRTSSSAARSPPRSAVYWTARALRRGVLTADRLGAAGLVPRRGRRPRRRAVRRAVRARAARAAGRHRDAAGRSGDKNDDKGEQGQRTATSPSTATRAADGSDVALEDRRLGQPGEPLADAAGPQLADALDGLQVVDAGGQQLLQGAEVVDQPVDDRARAAAAPWRAAGSRAGATAPSRCSPAAEAQGPGGGGRVDQLGRARAPRAGRAAPRGSWFAGPAGR